MNTRIGWQVEEEEEVAEEGTGGILAQAKCVDTIYNTKKRKQICLCSTVEWLTRGMNNTTNMSSYSASATLR
jgi:hypothetical protein